MPRKKKKKKIDKRPPLEWSVDPETRREIIAIFLLVLGVILLLATLNLAGNMGEALLTVLEKLFGFLGFFVSVAFIVIGAALLLRRLPMRPTRFIGIVLSFVTVPSIFYPYAGVFGDLLGAPLRGAIGLIASFLVSLALSLVTLLLAADTSIAKLRGLSESTDDQAEEEDEAKDVNVNVNNQGVTVFDTARKGLSLAFANRRRKQEESSSVPVMSTSKVVPVSTVKTRDKSWTLPSLELLETTSTRPDPGNVKKNVASIEKTLKDFGIAVTMSDVNVGPTVTQYTLKPAEGVKLNQITARTNDLALTLAAHPIRIEAPIPGKAAVGVEIPNKEKAIVSLKEILATDEFKKEKSNLALALGRDVAGLPVVIDLGKAPHMLIAGATGSGKSVAINTLLISLLYQNAPADLRLLLVDPKRVEFIMYNDIPHLLCPVITEPEKTISALKWAVAEMERRYVVLEKYRQRNISEFNTINAEDHLPYIIIVIDELADLMVQAAKEVEDSIVRLAQKARAVGMHLIVATQRPSVDVITGLIKANITTRIAFAVASQIDSRTILDQAGAERLLGNGDMLYQSSDSPQPRRVQGVFASSKEVDGVTSFLRDAGPAEYKEEILTFRAHKNSGLSAGDGAINDEMYDEAKDLVMQAGKASASLLQRRLRVGYSRAARLLDIMEEQGIVGPQDGAKPREVLVDRMDYQGSGQAVDSVDEDRYQ